MAEYIDREYLENTYLCSGIACKECSFFNEKKETCNMVIRADNIPNAYVVERSKIDRAIEEIKEKSKYTSVTGVKMYNLLNLDDVLEILKRNVEE